MSAGSIPLPAGLTVNAGSSAPCRVGTAAPPRRSTPSSSTRRRARSTSSCGALCDWYIEFSKPILTGADEAAKAETRAVTAWVLGEVAHLLQPDDAVHQREIWENLPGAEAGRLISAALAGHPAAIDEPAAPRRDGWVVR